MPGSLIPTKTGFVNQGNVPVPRRNIVTGEIIMVPPGATSTFSQAERDALNIQGASGGGNLLTGGNGILKNPVTGIVAGVATAGLADAALAGVEAGSAGVGAGSTLAAAGAPATAAAVEGGALGTGGAALAGAGAATTLNAAGAPGTADAVNGGAITSGQEATGAAVAPGAPATMPAATPEAGGAAVKAGTTLDTIKSLAPAVNAGLTAVGLGMAANAKSPDMGDTPSPVAPELPTTDAVNAQNAIDPDLSAIRRKNALLFGLDSPSNTDLTKGNASTGNLGRVTLLGGTSRLG